MEAREMLHENGTRTVADESYTKQLRTKWGKLLEGITDTYKANVTAVLCENETTHLRTLNEETLQSGVGSFTKYIFPILRRVFPNLIAHEIMSVQPMTAPIGAVFFYEYVHSNAKGGIASGDNLIETFSEWYSAEYVAEESLATGDGVDTSWSETLAWTPIRPLDADYGWSVTITDGTEIFTDNGSGVLTGDAGGSGTVNYTTGEVSVTFNAAVTNNQAITANYYYNSESNSQIPEVELNLTMVEVRAQTRKLKARWSAEAADDLRAFHGIDAEAELVAGIANEIALEIDRELIDMLVSNAGISTTWTYTNPTNSARELDAVRNLLTLLSGLSARIHRDSKRAPANFIVTTPEVCALLEQLTTHGDYRPAYVSNPNSPFGPADAQQGPTYGPLTSNFGIQRVGTLMQKWAVYQDPFLSAATAAKTLLLGLKGRNFMDAGAVYAPYIPLQVTPTFLDPDDFTFRKGMRTRYSKKMLRTEYYATIAISGLPTASL